MAMCKNTKKTSFFVHSAWVERRNDPPPVCISRHKPIVSIWQLDTKFVLYRGSGRDREPMAVGFFFVVPAKFGILENQKVFQSRYASQIGNFNLFAKVA